MKRTYKHEYNGWKNYETWNVALWLDNDEGYYNLMRSYVNLIAKVPGMKPNYREMITHIYPYRPADKTPDKVKFIQTRLSYKQLNAMLQEQVDEIRSSK